MYVVTATQRVVVYKRGYIIRLWKPGLHLYWPFWTRIKEYDINRQIMQLHFQRLVTKDGRCVQIGATVPYRINDPIKLDLALSDESDTMCDEALPIIAEYVFSTNYKDLRSTSKESKLFMRQ